jgi:hypothetical protein
MTAKTRIASGVAAVIAMLACSVATAAVQINVVNADGPGEGFNDPTPVAPVGGNPGTTLGQQRLYAFAYVANIWGANLTSSVPVLVQAEFNPLACTSTGAVLGSAGATQIFADDSFPKADTWYSFALANKIAGIDIVPGFPQLRARFNSNLGNPGCLDGSPFYLGVDNNVPAGQVNLVATLLHEFGHGLGFQTFTSGSTGAPLAGLPSIWDHYLYDNTAGKTWVQMTNAERAASAINPRQLVWTGSNVTTAAPTVLSLGTPELTVLAPAGVQGTYLAGSASFGPPLSDPGLTRQVAQVVDQADGRGLACVPLDATNVRRVKQRIAIVDRGVCGFTVKVKNAQDAGAVGVIVVDSAAGGPPPGMSGADPTVAIPAIRVTLADGNKLKAALNGTPSDRSTGLVARIGTDLSQLAGADNLDRVMMYTPNPFASGSSVSHYDTSAFRNLLMEPSINSDLTQSLVPPEDLTVPLLKDIGW